MKTRLDTVLVERGLAENRSKAQAFVLSGAVSVAGTPATKPGLRIPPDADVSLKAPRKRYVSRAGEKLAHALDDFSLDVSGRLCLDAGASTGGFTDVLLRRGASRVIAVDVGYGQFDFTLRNDERVEVMERTNIRYLTADSLPYLPDLLVSDLSFISLSVALETLLTSTLSITEAVLLVKPQFEAGPEKVGRGGLVRDPEVHAEVILEVARRFDALGFGAADIARSAITGKKSGNQEYVIHLRRDAHNTLKESDIAGVVCGGE